MMKEFYTADDLVRLTKKYKFWRAVLIVFSAAVLCACIVIVAFTNGRNEGAMRIAVSVTSGVGGAVAIYIASFPFLGSRRLAEHISHMLEGEREEHVGAAKVSPVKFKIRNSITVRKVTLTDGGREERVNVNSDMAYLVPQDGKRYAFGTVHGYIVAVGDAPAEVKKDEEIL
ncbi:MAG: hypothetical protein IJS45_09100 [Clostridia bacterium]|nr:hypothetical protein [Clostridia bacterium]